MNPTPHARQIPQAGYGFDSPPLQDSRNLIISSCGARKAPHPTIARLLYTGCITTAALRAAAALTCSENIRILSARHGLVELDTVLKPYEQRLDRPGAISVERVRDQAEASGLLDHRRVIVLAGAAYTNLAQQIWPHAELPLAGSRGIGEYRRRLADLAKGPDSPVPA